MKIPQDNDSAQKALEDIYLEERYEQKDGSKVQSINDNSSQFSSMYGALEKYFVKLEFEKKYALFHQIIGGIRLKSIEKERELAKFIKVMDDLLCENQSIDPTNFFYAGKRKK
jgi:hypothetical protein